MTFQKLKAQLTYESLKWNNRKERVGPRCTSYQFYAQDEEVLHISTKLELQ